MIDNGSKMFENMKNLVDKMMYTKAADDCSYRKPLIFYSFCQVVISVRKLKFEGRSHSEVEVFWDIQKSKRNGCV